MSAQMQSIYRYIIHNLVNEPAAFRLQEVLKGKLNTIANQPKIGTTITTNIADVVKEFADVRKLTINNYIILYDYNEETSNALVTHVFHQTQDYGRLFQH